MNNSTESCDQCEALGTKPVQRGFRVLWSSVDVGVRVVRNFSGSTFCLWFGGTQGNIAPA